MDRYSVTIPTGHETTFTQSKGTLFYREYEGWIETNP